MNHIHTYLSQNLDILNKKFVFFTVNENNNHWSGWAAVNPWVMLAGILYERANEEGTLEDSPYKDFAEYGSFAHGLISCNGIRVKGYADAKCVIWFLNL